MKYILLLSLVIAWMMPLHAANCCPSGTATAIGSPTSSQPSAVLTRAGRKYQINQNLFIKFNWNQRPRIGNRILSVELLDSNNNKLTNLNVTANAYMPSMRGAHDTGDRPMQLNRNQRYSIPVHFMMLGDWEIEIKIRRGNALLGNAVVRLDI